MPSNRPNLQTSDSEKLLFDFLLAQPETNKPQEQIKEDVSDTPLSVSNLFQHHDTHPILLELVMAKQYEVGWLAWDPEALREGILSDFKIDSISQLVWAKLQMIRALHSSQMFWTDWNVFAPLCQILNNNCPDFEQLVIPGIEQLFVAVDISKLIRESTFSDEIAKFVAAAAIEDGINYLPDLLSFAEIWLAEPMYECLVCGYTATIDKTPILCDSCIGRFSDGYPFNDKADPAAPKAAGQKIRTFFRRDPAIIEKFWESYKDVPIEHIQKYADHERYPDYIPGFKLLIARDYMNFRRAQLEEQRKAIGI